LVEVDSQNGRTRVDQRIDGGHDRADQSGKDEASDTEAEWADQVTDDLGISLIGILQIWEEPVCDHAGEADSQGQKDSEKAGEDDAGASIPFALGAEDPLIDVLVCGIVPKMRRNGQYEYAGPGQFGVVGREDKMCTVAGTAHRFPASDFVQAEKEYEQAAAQEQDGLKQIRPDNRGQAACDSVCAGDNCQRKDSEPEVDAKNGVQGQAACEQDAGQVDEDVGQDGDDAERESAGRSEAVLQPFGHRTDMFSKVEWHEKYDHDGHSREDAPLPVRYGDAVTVSKSNFANELLCRDARSDQRRADGVPRQSVAG